jgi:hypothetical protein
MPEAAKLHSRSERAHPSNKGDAYAHAHARLVRVLYKGVHSTPACAGDVRTEPLVGSLFARFPSPDSTPSPVPLRRPRALSVPKMGEEDHAHDASLSARIALLILSGEILPRNL